MNLSTRELSKFYELIPKDSKVKVSGTIICNKRILVGRSNNCDLTIASSSVSAIHAVIEISDVGGRVYDMNSESGTKVNGIRTFCQDLKVGDYVSFGGQEFTFKEYRTSTSLPPVLETSEQSDDSFREVEKIKGVIPAAPKTTGSSDISGSSITADPPPPSLLKELPKRPGGGFEIDPKRIITDDSGQGTPYISYPLARDPSTEFSEYIFEDADYIYPIFQWSIEKSAAEVIILHHDRIFSIDYLPERKDAYYIKGIEQSNKNIEFPYLRKTESIPFIKVSGGNIYIEDSLGYKGTLISDEINQPKDFQERSVKTPMTLGSQDILKLQKDDLQIFIRNTQSPPRVRPAPLFRRDNDSRKYFVTLAVLFLLLLGFFSSITINKEMEKEKQPERVATIIYNRKKFIAKKRRVIPKTTAKVRPQKVRPKSPTRPRPKPTPKPPTKAAQKAPRPVKKVVKKALPKKAIKRELKPVKRPSKSGVPKKVTQNKSASPQRRRSRRPRPSRGHVDAYRPTQKFSGRLSSLLAKGGKVSGVQAEQLGGESIGIQGGDLEGDSGKVRGTKITKNVGSLEGATTGKLDQAQGTEGLVNKKSVAVAGIPSRTVVWGDYDASIVADILRQHLPFFRRCYQKELDRENKVSGKVELHFNIGASGSVTKAGVTQSALPSSVDGCVINVLKGIKFPSPLGGGVVAIRQPMYFEPRAK